MNKLDKMLAEIPKEMSAEGRKRLEDTIIKEYYEYLRSAGYNGPSFMDIRKKRRELDEQATKVHLARTALMEECPHVNSTYEARGSSGNWDRDDNYWYNWECADCGKHWTTEQGMEARKAYPFATEVKKKY